MVALNVSDAAGELDTKGRLGDYFTTQELTKHIGHPPEDWWPAFLVEAVCNGLDATETLTATEAGQPPRREIEVAVGPGLLQVTDYGPGISRDVVVRSLDFGTRTTDKEAYVAPTRGRQGNAIKTMIAAPHVWSPDAPGSLVIEALGLRHDISVRMDRVANGPIPNHQETPSEVQTGSVFTIRRACSPPVAAGAELYFRDPAILVRAFALLNPHFRFRLSNNDEPSLEIPARARPTWRKWASVITPPHWYSKERFAGLLSSHVRIDRAKGVAPRSIRKSMESFDGFKRSDQRQAAYEAAGITAMTAGDLFPGGIEDTAQIGRLHLAMIATYKKPPGWDKLGAIGKAQMLDGLKTIYGCYDDEVKYASDHSPQHSSVPWVVEVAFGAKPDGVRTTVAGVNWTPSIKIPFEELKAALDDNSVGPQDSVVVAAHVILPGAVFVDGGKSRYQLPPDVTAALSRLVEAVTKDWRRWKASDARSQRKDRRETDRLGRAKKRAAGQDIIDAAFAVLPAAYAHAAGTLGTTTARQVMYEARRMILNDPNYGPLFMWKSSNYFTQDLLPTFIREHPALTKDWDVTYDDRGHFAEPHTGHKFGIGTVNVRNYVAGWDRPETDGKLRSFAIPTQYPTLGPGGRYKNALFVEKEGFHELFKRARLQDEFDIALMSTKGMSVVACRSVVDWLSRSGVRTFILHDFDKSGLNILNTFRVSNDRYTFEEKPDVIDLGLRLTDVLDPRWDLGDEAELVTYPPPKDRTKNKSKRRRKAEPSGPRAIMELHGATPEELDFLAGKEPLADGSWQGRRVELNAFVSDRLLEYIKTKLVENGVTKFIPEGGTLTEAYELATRRAAVQRAIQAAIDAENRRPVRPPPNLLGQVEKLLADHPDIPWDEAVHRIATKRAARRS